MFPIEKPALRDRLYDLMALQWSDNQKSCELTESGTYECRAPADGEAAVNSQEACMAAPSRQGR